MLYGTFHRCSVHFVLKEPESMAHDLASTLLNSLSMPVVAIDKRGHIVTLNAAARQLLPDGSAEPVGADASAMFPAWSSVLKDIKAHPEGFRAEIALDQTHVAEIIVSPISDHGSANPLHGSLRSKETTAR